MRQASIPAVYMRGGTSRALMFHERDLPPAGAARDGILCAALGSPDPHGRQLDGMGGGASSLSKIAIIGPPSDRRADIDYTFGQIDIRDAAVSYRGNCGNISAAVGPFALDEGLVRVEDGPCRVVIHNTNTRKLIEARFGVTNGRADVTGDCVVAGVAGSGAPIELAFLEPGGAVTGRLLPTGQASGLLDIPLLGAIEASIVDASNPTVFVHAAALGLDGGQTAAALAADGAAMEALRQIRAAAAVAAGLIEHASQALTTMRNLPLVCIVSRGGDAGAGPPRIRARMVSADQPHGATPLTGAMCLAVAAQLPGTVVAALLPAARQGGILIEHASGMLPVSAVIVVEGGQIVVHETVVQRTARRLMDGRVYYLGGGLGA